MIADAGEKPMNKKFTKFCITNWFGPPNGLAIPGLGIAGEAGEVADKIKKSLRGDKVEPQDIVIEVGDVLYYCVIVLNRLGYTLDDAMQMEMDKLLGRLERGTMRGDGDKR